MSKHYAKYSNSAFRVEYIGRRPRNDCIKTIQVEGEWKYARARLLLFSPDGTRVLCNSKRGVSVWDATSGELIAGPMLAEDNEDDKDDDTPNKADEGDWPSLALRLVRFVED